MIYYYDSAGRLWKEAFLNGNHFIHSYYGTDGAGGGCSQWGSEPLCVEP